MYESFYSLRAKPFQLSPDPRFFYNSQTHKRALAYLRYGVQQGEGFIVITGDVGTGKTTLVGTLFRYLQHEKVVVGQVVTTQLHATEFLRMVAKSFGVSHKHPSKGVLLGELESFFRSTAREGRRALLIVDEAQGLPQDSIEELRMLSNFQTGAGMLVQTFLLGQREFRDVMRSEGFEQLRQRVIASYHLRPLDFAETQEYIEHRLLTAGWNGDPKITADVYGRIFEFTRGVPRRINTLCDRLLLYGSLEELHVIDTAAFCAVERDVLEEQGPHSEPAETSTAFAPTQGTAQLRNDLDRDD